MRVVVDAMGGDFGPKVTVEGAVRAAQEFKVEVLLVGAEELIKKELDRFNASKGKVTLVDAAEAIDMGEGVLAFRRKQRSSIRVGTQLVKKGEAEAFVSTGNTAAIVYLSKKILGALKGVEKPGLSLLVPTIKGLTLLIDVGANVNCRPHHLEQFALMGHIFMESVMGLEEPRIGLMSIGEERSKGNELTKEVFERLQSSTLNFIGNIEGKDIYSGKADVIVSDGFTGNVALKVSEGVVDTIFYMARNEVMKNIFSKIGFFLMKRNLKKLYRKVDYTEYGGAQLLGINGVCIIGHGRSNANAVKNAVGLARDFIVNKVQEKIQSEVARLSQTFDGAKT
ncbi:MAG: phosphate acyltransferase PlsX [Candidatus Aminicenantes bacterium]|nr:MAG: phosphate acyltransferase PlsX [Candidatus Aminicenantes bacterium]